MSFRLVPKSVYVVYKLKTINFANITARRTEMCVFDVLWRLCKARIETNDGIVVAEYGNHHHSHKA